MKRIINIVTAIGLVALVSSCEHKVETGTTVHEDGSLEKVITFEKDDDSNADNNYFGIKPGEDWEMNVESRKDNNGSSSKKSEYLTFKKTFDSDRDANDELDTSVDSLFSSHSSFHKSFRWFYTYIYYSDSYRAFNRFRHLPVEQLLTPEDLQFIDRLPAEGQNISMADSIYLEGLGKKIYEDYLVRAYYAEHVHILSQLISKHNIGDQFQDTLMNEKTSFFERISNDDNEDPLDNIDEDLALILADSLGIPLTEAAREDYPNYMSELESRMDFMVWTNDADFTHTLNVPWELVETNADSVANNMLLWEPPVTKLLFKDYEMYVVVRKMNVWTLIVSGLVVLIALYLVLKRS